MKIGIITIHNSPNYGATLQAFALYKYIAKQGYDCEIIDLHRPHQQDFVASNKYKRYRNDSLIVIIKKVIKLLIGKKDVHYAPIAKNKFDSFNSQIRLSRPYFSVDEIYENPPQYDIYITGSDQLWNPTQPFCLEPYFLTFAPISAKKISYAASIGVTRLLEREKKDFKCWLSSYSAISVREKQAKDLLESFIGKEVTQVLDPTFLLDVEYWQSLAQEPVIQQPYILLFTLSFQPEILRYALRLSHESGLPLYSLGQIQPKVSDGSYTAIRDAGPYEWLGYISNATMVITDSFHGTVFSIILGSGNFYTYINPSSKRASRILDLLSLFDLKDHLLNPEFSQSYVELNENCIDRSLILSRIEKQQAFSRKYLLDQLQK